MIWVTGDPEDGYFGDDEVLCFDRVFGPVVLVEGVYRRITEADCTICGGTLSNDAKIPLCKGCERDCKREVKEQQAHREWGADGSPR